MNTTLQRTDFELQIDENYRHPDEFYAHQTRDQNVLYRNVKNIVNIIDALQKGAVVDQDVLGKAASVSDLETFNFLHENCTEKHRIHYCGLIQAAGYNPNSEVIEHILNYIVENEIRVLPRVFCILNYKHFDDEKRYQLVRKMLTKCIFCSINSFLVIPRTFVIMTIYNDLNTYFSKKSNRKHATGWILDWMSTRNFRELPRCNFTYLIDLTSSGLRAQHGEERAQEFLDLQIAPEN
jgi:hypothetical protein